MANRDRALVLAGGGVAGIAWMLGLVEFSRSQRNVCRQLHERGHVLPRRPGFR